MRSHKAPRIIIALCFIVLAFPARFYAQPPNPPLDVIPDRSVGVLSEDPGYGERWSTSIFPFGNYVGPDTGQDVFCRTYLRFPIPSLLQGESIAAAVLAVYVDDYWPAPGSAFISVYPVLEDWTPEGVDWYDMAAWPALGAPVATTEVTSQGIPEGVCYTWDVTGLVQSWLNGTPNYGLALAAADLDQVTDNWAAARRLRAEDPTTRPFLTIYQVLPTPVSSETPPPPPTAAPQPTTAPQPAAATATPVLTPIPIPILLPETGHGGVEAALTWGGVLLGLMLAACGIPLLLAHRRPRRR